MDRTFMFDYLISKSSFDKTDFELIHAEKTSESKAGRFLDILEMKGESAFYHFIDALQILNPSLYEILTGESATKRNSPMLSDMKSHIISDGGSSFLDVDILSNYSKILTEKLQDLTLRHDQVLKDNNELRKKLEDTLLEQERKQRRIDSLEKQVLDTEDALASEAQSSANKTGENLMQRFEVVQREGRTNQFIIQLQMRLLTAHEENENLRQQLDEVRARGDELLKQLSRVNVDYAFERKETTKLSQQLRFQTAEMKTCESLKMKLREVQFASAKLQCELQDKENDLTEVKRWTEALKARFDLIVVEKKEILKNQEIVDGECSRQRDEISDLKIKLNHKERAMEELKRNCNEVEESSKIYREERDFYSKSMADTVLELEQMREETEEAAQRHKKALESKESSLRQQTEYLRQFEKKYEDTKAELASVKTVLNKEKADNEELRKRIATLEAELKQKESTSKPYEEEGDHLDGPEASQTQDPHEPEPSGPGNNNGVSIDWKFKEREAKELVGSILRRFTRTDQQPTAEPRAKNKAIRKSKSFDEKLVKLVPEFESLPLKTRQDCSLDRHRMKQSLPYQTLAAMCPTMTSVGDAFPDALSAAISVSSDGLHAANRRGARKMSAPVVSELLSFHRQDSNLAGKDRDEIEDGGVNASLGSVAGEGMEVFEDDHVAAENQFRARSRAIRLKDGERRINRRLTEPSIQYQDYS
ncbi:hypothetical protein ACROYT_G037718 [Oculina patagonica]